jgi:hypothetical protein
MRFAIVTNGTDAVVREFDAPSDYTAPTHKFGPDKAERVVMLVEVEPPTLSAGQVLQRTEEVTETELRRGWVAVAAPVPQEVPTWSLREVCMIRGHTAAIAAAIDALPEPPREIAKNRWNHKGTISRGSNMITLMQGILDWEDAYVDELFIAADVLDKS